MPYQNHIKSIYGPYMGHPRSRNWTLDFAPAFSHWFYPTLRPRSYFQTRQRFSFPKHVTSGSMSPRSYFHTAQRFSFPKHVTSGFMSPQSLFPTSQRFPIPLPVMTSLDQSEASITCYLSPIYYWLASISMFTLSSKPAFYFRIIRVR